MAETGQPYAFTGDDPLNATDPLGLTAGPMKSPAWICAHEHGVKNCLHKAKKAQSCGRLGCYDAENAHKALPEAIGVTLFVTTGGLGDLALESFGEAASTARAVIEGSSTASKFISALPIVATSAATSVGLRNLEENFDATANNPSASPLTRGVAGFDAGVIRIVDPIATWHDEWDIFNDG